MQTRRFGMLSSLAAAALVGAATTFSASAGTAAEAVSRVSSARRDQPAPVQRKRTLGLSKRRTKIARMSYGTAGRTKKSRGGLYKGSKSAKLASRRGGNSARY